MTIDGITSETILKELFDRYPSTILFFIRKRMNCVGCYMSTFDTLGDAVENYHFDWSTFITELKVSIKSEPVHKLVNSDG